MPTRLLKPGVRDSDAIDQLTPMGETFFYRLLVTVDDFGRCDARPAMIKSHCFPIKDAVTAKTCIGLLEELGRAGLVAVYEVDGKPYLQMLKWDNIPRAKESKFPPHENACKQMHADADGAQTNAPLTVTDTDTDTDTVTDIRKPEPGGRADAPPSMFDEVGAVFECWKTTMESPRSLLDDKRKKAIKAALKTGYTVEQLCEAIDGCAKSEFHMGKNDRGEKYNGIDLILRSAEKIDKFIVIGKSPLIPHRPGGPPKTYHDISGMDYSKGVDEHGNF